MTKIQGNQGNKNVKMLNNAFLLELNLLRRKKLQQYKGTKGTKTLKS